MNDKPSVTVTREHRREAIEIRDNVEFGDMGTPGYELDWANTGELTSMSASLHLLKRIARAIAEAEQRGQSRGAGRASEPTQREIWVVGATQSDSLVLRSKAELAALSDMRRAAAVRYVPALPESPTQPGQALVARLRKLADDWTDGAAVRRGESEARHETYAAEVREELADELRAALEAAAKPVESLAGWAVRVLDAWAALEDERNAAPIRFGGEWCVRLRVPAGYGCDDIEDFTVSGPTPEAARIACARALYAADPSLPSPPAGQLETGER